MIFIVWYRANAVPLSLQPLIDTSAFLSYAVSLKWSSIDNRPSSPLCIGNVKASYRVYAERAIIHQPIIEHRFTFFQQIKDHQFTFCRRIKDHQSQSQSQSTYILLISGSLKVGSSLETVATSMEKRPIPKTNKMAMCIQNSQRTVVMKFTMCSP